MEEDVEKENQENQTTNAEMKKTKEEHIFKKPLPFVNNNSKIKEEIHKMKQELEQRQSQIKQNEIKLILKEMKWCPPIIPEFEEEKSEDKEIVMASEQNGCDEDDEDVLEINVDGDSLDYFAMDIDL